MLKLFLWWWWWGVGYAQLFADLCFSLGVLETQAPRKGRDGCIRKIIVLRIAHAWVSDFRSFANFKFRCPVIPRDKEYCVVSKRSGNH